MAVVIESAKTVGIPSSIGSSGSPRLGVTVHYIGASSVPRNAHADCRSRVRGWHNYHKNTNKWAGIGYNFLICHHGIVMTGRGLNRVGAHNTTANSTYQGVCFMIGGSQEPTAAQLKGFRDLLTWMKARGVNTNNIKGHRNHISTSCPGGPLYSRVQSGNWGAGGSVSPSPGTSYKYWSVAGIQIPTGSPNIAEGDRGTPVTRLQNGLLKWRSGILPKYGADGDFGDESVKALKTFQSAHGLSADGIYGPASASKLRSALGGSGSPTEGDDDVPSRNLYATTSGYVQTVEPGEWHTLRFDRIFRNGKWENKTAEPSVIFGPQFYSASAFVRVQGLEKGQEFQMRFAYYREADGGGYERYASMPIHSPTHDAGQGHFVTNWTGHVSGSKKGRVRVEVVHYGETPVQITASRVEALVWDG